MWIFLCILLFLALLITVILMLPVDVIIKTDEKGELIFRYKLLFKTYGENPNPNDPIVKTLKKAAGVDRLDKQKIKASAEHSGVLHTLVESIDLIKDLLKEIVGLLKYCTAKKLKINIVCAADDAFETAITYGECYAVVAPLVGFIHGAMKVKKSGRSININCDFLSSKGLFEFETVITVKLFRVIAAFLRATWAEAMRIAEAKQQEEIAKVNNSTKENQK